MRFASDAMGKFDTEFLEFRSIRSIGQEILELNYDLAIAALYFPRLIESTKASCTVTPTSDLLALSSLGSCESYFLAFFRSVTHRDLANQNRSQKTGNENTQNKSRKNIKITKEYDS